MTITLPDNLAQKLPAEAQNQQLSIDELIADILADAVEPQAASQASIETIVAKIKGTNSDSEHFHSAIDSLADLFASAPFDPAFDLQQWQIEWVEAEAEIKTFTRANARAEARGRC